MKGIGKESFERIASDCASFARAAGFDVRMLTNGAPVLLRDGVGKRLSILSGLHGDERSGPLFLRERLRLWRDGDALPASPLVIVPILNDVGWDKRDRKWRGLDLNRGFHDNGPSIVRELLSIYETLKLRLHWDLHEDPRAMAPFVYDYEPEQHDLNRRLAAHLGVEARSWVSMRKQTSETFAKRLGVRYTITTEMSPRQPLAARLAMLEKAYRFLIREIEG